MILARTFAAAALCLSLGTASLAQDIPDTIAAAVANPARNADNVARDPERKAGEVLAHYGIEPGMQVVDLFAAGGYFTEVLAGAVGPEGHVYAHQTERGLTANREAWEAQYEAFGNISIAEMTDGHFALEDNSVDFVLFGLVLHHFHYDEATPDQRPAGADDLYAEVMRVLRPGGTFGVIEHVARAGSSREESASWHRIDLETAIADISGAGFTYVGNADTIHVNPEDDNANYWYDTGLRGHTNRMVLSFTKSE